MIEPQRRRGAEIFYLSGPSASLSTGLSRELLMFAAKAAPTNTLSNLCVLCASVADI
jgi:hypothetical protein